MTDDQPISVPASPVTTKSRGIGHPLVRAKRAILAGAAMTLLGIALAGCANVGPEPVAFDQNPGNASPPNAFGD